MSGLTPMDQEKAGAGALVEYFKLAELWGSRGRARWAGKPEPEGADYDFVVFTDDPDQRQRLATILGVFGIVQTNEVEDFWVKHGDVDLCVMWTWKRNILSTAYRLQEDKRLSKADMTAFIKAESWRRYFVVRKAAKEAAKEETEVLVPHWRR